MAQDRVSVTALEIARFLRGGQASLPVDVDAVAARLGVQVRERHRFPFLGLLEEVDGRLTVSLLANQGSTRRRFTLAHELAHAYLYLTTAEDQLDGGFEHLCDEVAAALLVPGEELRARIAQPITVSRLIQLSREFDVSLQTMAIQLVDEMDGVLGFAYRRRDGRTWAVGALRGDRYTGGRLVEVVESGRPLAEPVTRARTGDIWRLEVSLISASAAIAVAQLVDGNESGDANPLDLGEAA